MKNKFLIIVATVVLLVSLVVKVKAATVAVTIPAGVMTNLFVPSGGSVLVTSVMAVSPVNNTTAFAMYDTPTNATTYIQAAYIGVSSSQTNYITTWTNYYGKVNSFTNVAQLEVTNTVSSITNAYPLRLQANLLTNSTVTFPLVNYYFQNGLWVTNTGVGAVTVNITYQK